MIKGDGYGHESFPSARLKTAEIIRDERKHAISHMTKEEKFDELQSWYWWLKRRTHNGNTHSQNLKTFLNGIADFFDELEEDKDGIS